MKIAIIGSRSMEIESIEEYVLAECTEIVTGGARGVDACAARFARENGIPLTVFLPDYKRYGRGGAIIRNRKIVEYADIVLAFWDGVSRGTKNVIDECEKSGKPVKVILINKEE